MLFVFPGDQRSNPYYGSILTASLYRVLLDMPPAILLGYFCYRREVSSARDPIFNLPAHIMSQLLVDDAYFRADGMSFNRRLPNRSVPKLLEILKYLVSKRALSYGTIFLLIDDFWILGGTADPVALQQLMAVFSDIVKACSESGSVILKILFMTPGSYSEAMASADRADVLRITSESKTVSTAIDPMHTNHELAAARENAFGYP